ncbi:MAG TPA: BON domain-containing protein [Thermoanaerobaculia bacterium]|nr:BON domain-containing protein [Thermoanaerobaculia bacterium]
MRRKALYAAAAFCLGLAPLLLAGCSREDRPVIETRRDAKGNEQIHIDNERLKSNLEKANQELKKDASNLGKAIEDGAKKIDDRVGPAAREALSDAVITTRVKARLVAAPDLGGIHIHVDTRDGQVTLSGTVATEEAKLEAQKITRRTEGVQGVVNQLQVGTVG